jgi:hypothetical protein
MTAGKGECKKNKESEEKERRKMVSQANHFPQSLTYPQCATIRMLGACTLHSLTHTPGKRESILPGYVNK